jgi:hypothetical protein
MDQGQLDLIQQWNRTAVQRTHGQLGAHLERPTIHFTELPEDTSDSPIASEWNFYRREAGRLLADGNEGKWVLIRGEEINGIWDTEEQAYAIATRRYPMQPVLIRQVLTREVVLRCSRFLG